MRAFALLIVAALLASGCISSATVSPTVSVDFSKSSQNRNGETTFWVSATLTGVSGMSDWREIQVTGCSAPAEGPFELPHSFSGCGSYLRITHVESGTVLYSS